MNADLFATIYSPPSARTPWRIDDLLPGFDCRYYSYARRALAAGLGAAGIRTGARVLLPEFICGELLSAIVAVGAKPVFYPVGKDCAPSSHPDFWPPAAAVVAVNYFGFPQKMEPFIAYCRRTGAVSIEDNAHGLFSRDGDGGALLGTRADIGLFSLRKSLPLADGAVLLLKEGARKWEPVTQSPFNEHRTGAQRLKHAMRRSARIFGAAPVFHVLSAFRTLRVLALAGRRIGGRKAETDLPFPKIPCSELATSITAGDPVLEALRRRALYQRISDMLAPHVSPVFPSLKEGVSPYGFAFRCGKNEAKVKRILAGVAMACLPWPSLPNVVAETAPPHYLDMRFTPFLA